MKKITLMLVLLCSMSTFATRYLVQLGTSGAASWRTPLAGETLVNLSSPAQSFNVWYNATVVASDEVWIATGTYVLTGVVAITKANHSVFGGFVGTETATNQRYKVSQGYPWEYSNETILDGNNAVQVLFADNTYANVVFDGLTITKSNAANAAAQYRDGVTLQNCKIINNVSTGNGGGVTFFNGGTIRNTYIANNTGANGGGLYSNNASGPKAIVDGCVIENNTGTNTCGGIRVQGASTAGIEVTNCIIRGNKSGTTDGGAIYTNSINNNFINCLVYNNTGKNALYINGGNFTNVMIVNNVGSPAVNLTTSTLVTTITNCVIWGNKSLATSGNDQGISGTITNKTIFNSAAYPAISVYSDVSNITLQSTNDSQTGTKGPGFVLPTTFFGAPINGTQINEMNASDWRIKSTSGCLNLGKTLAAVTTDILGTARPQGGAYDIGAYEFPYAYTLSSGTTNASSMIDNPSCAVTVNGIGTILNIDANKTFASLTVAPGAQVTLNNTKTLNPGTFTLQSDATGTATFVDNNATGAAITATVQQYLPSARNWYISSPIVTAQVPVASTYSYWNEPTGVWASAVAGAEQTMGKGYIARPVSAVTLAYAGTLNNNQTPISIGLTRTATVTKEGFNLLGNPFPSYLNWKLVYDDAENTTAGNVDPTIWYRTKNAAGTYVFATYNAVDNLGSTINEDPKDVATGNIPPMQGFWVRVNNGQTAGTLKLKNSMRAHKGTQLQADAITYNDAIRRAPSVINPTQVLRLQVSNAANSDEAIVLFNSNAVDNFDAYDSPKMMNNNAVIPEIYTTVENEKVVINGFKELKSNVEIPLGFVPGSATSFTLKATQFSNFEKGTQVLLIDKAEGSRTIDITDGTAYQFYADNSIPASKRFSLMFKLPSSETNLKNLSVNEVLIYRNANREIVLRISGEKNVENTVSGFNVLGQKLFTQKVTQSLTVLKSFQGLSGVYFVTVNTTGGKSSQKIILD